MALWVLWLAALGGGGPVASGRPLSPPPLISIDSLDRPAAPAEGQPALTPPPLPTPVSESAPVPQPSPESQPPPQPKVEPEPKADADTGGTFVKGELSSYLGADRLVVKNTRIGVSLGIDRFQDAYYGLVEPLVDFRFLNGKLGFGIGAPLRLELLSFATDPATGDPELFKNLGRLRTEDWDSVHDFGRVLKYVTYGRKEDRFYLSVGQRYATSIGHGAHMRRYSPNLDTNYPRVSAEVDAYNDFGGFELMTNDVLEFNQLAGIAFLKPFSFFNPQSVPLKTLSVGLSGAVDWKAPYHLVVDGSGLRKLDHDDRLLTTDKLVALVGVDVEVKIVKTKGVDIKPYIDYSMMVGGDGGLTLGLLGRFNVGEEVVNAFRLILEGRYLGNRYMPSYFDSFYEVDRFVFLELPRVNPSVANFAPKSRYVLEHGLGERVGYYVEGNWGIPGAIGLTLALQGVSNSPAADFVAHLEVPVLNFFQFFGSYYLRGVESLSELGLQSNTKTLGLFGDRAVAFAGARLKVFPFLYVNARAYKTFRMNRELLRYDNQFGLVIDVEIGYEFHPSDPS